MVQGLRNLLFKGRPCFNSPALHGPSRTSRSCPLVQSGSIPKALLGMAPKIFQGINIPLDAPYLFHNLPGGGAIWGYYLGETLLRVEDCLVYYCAQGLFLEMVRGLHVVLRSEVGLAACKANALFYLLN